MAFRKLTAQRSGYRRDITKRIAQIDELLENFDQSKENNLRVLRNALETKKQTCLQLDQSILDLVSEEPSEEAVDQEISSAGEAIDVIDNALGRIDSFLIEFNNQVATDQSNDRHHKIGGKARLPKLELMKFNGDPKSFQAFFDSFQSVIHNNHNLSDIDRFNYLKTQLVGPAANSIAGLPCTSDNYQVAIDILKDRFGKKAVVISSHMDALMKIPTVFDSADTRALRRVYDKVETHVRSLEAMGIDSENYGTLLVPVILSRLPEETKLILSRSFRSDDEIWKLEDLLLSLKQEIEALERTVTISAGGRVSSERPTASALLTNTTFVENGCCFCRGRHAPAQCRMISNVDARKAVLMKTRRCFQCLKIGHTAKHCRLPPCAKCNRNHHAAICTAISQEEIDFNTSKRGSWGYNNHGGMKHNSRGYKNHVEESTGYDEGRNQAAACTNQMGKSQNYEDRVCNDQLPNGIKNRFGKSGRETAQTAKGTKGSSSALYVDVSTSVLLQTAKALARSTSSPGNEVNIRLILDPGSQRTYVSQRLFECLDLPTVGKETLRINTFGGQTSVLESCPVTQLSLRGRFGGQEIFVMACVVPEISVLPGNQQIQFAKENFEHLFELQLADDGDGSQNENSDLDVLVGSDFYWAFILDHRKRGKSGPVAIETRLGWVLSGPVSSGAVFSGDQDSHTMNFFIAAEKRDEISGELSKFWALEGLGIDSQEEADHLETFSKTLQFNGERYEVGLPFRQNHGVIADNYVHCCNRLKSTLSKLRKEPNLLEQYNEIMREQINSGVLEAVSGDAPVVGEAYYMPHFCVVREDKESTKVRVVYDASSKVAGPSLNECIYEGPSLLTEIFEVLVRFRLYPIGITADIEKAFHQVSIREQDRDFLRVLWVDDVQSENPKIIVLRFTRCVFGVSSSPFHLNATLRHHLGKYQSTQPSIVSKLRNSLYVDDVTVGVDTVEEGKVFFETSKNIMNSGGFNLRKWATNSEELAVIMDFSSEKQVCDHQTFASYSLQNADLPKDSKEQKVLGVLWDREKDKISFRFNGILQAARKIKYTKRGVLSLVAKNYDPLGIISPIIISMKIAFQNLCKQGGGWDVDVDKETENFVKQWLQQLAEVSSLSCPRYCVSFLKQDIINYHLIGFCDASNSAYGGSLYIRTESQDNISTNLLVSKTKVAPLQALSIPRLELLGMLVLAKLVSSVVKVISNIITPTIVLFSDSMTALYWVKNENRRYKQWVERRADAIRSLTPNAVWNHVQGKENPADLQSRGATPAELQHSTLWFQGPQWLRKSLSEWPSSQLTNETEESKIELSSAERKAETLACLAVEHGFTSIIDYERFTTLDKLMRVMAYALRFVRKCRNTRLVNNMQGLNLSAEELSQAEMALIKDAQSQLRQAQNFKLLTKQLLIYQDEMGMLRSKGRFENAELTNNEKFPYIIPRTHLLSELIARHYHVRTAHRGVEDTMAEIRTKFWIPSLRQLVKRVVHSCYACKRLEGMPYNARPFPPLPAFRVQFDEPFKTVGTDFAGPVYIRNSESEDGKSYILLFTCSSSRAVHLELVSDLSATVFVNGLRRFIARRGAPHLIISDNAKTFSASETQEFLLARGITWKFNVPDAPWRGGFFESMIKITKRCLRKVLLKAKLNYEEMCSTLVEIESVLNNRPLTYVDNDTTIEPLTPNHLIFGRRLAFSVNALSHASPTVEHTHEELNKRVKYKQKLLSDFKARWSRDYLLSLRQSLKLRKLGDQRKPNIGDVVLVHDNERRINWRMARIVELHESKDGEIRSAKLLMGSSNLEGPRKYITRAIERLYPLEVMVAEMDFRVKANTISEYKTDEEASSESGSSTWGSIREEGCEDEYEDRDVDDVSEVMSNEDSPVSLRSSKSDFFIRDALQGRVGKDRRSPREAAIMSDFRRRWLDHR